MKINVRENPTLSLADYEAIPISFRVERVLRMERPPENAPGFIFSEEPLDAPYVKDYDWPDSRPTVWAKHWDISKWGIFSAEEGGRLVGGAVVAWDTPEILQLQGRRDICALWDIRVLPSHRGRGVGTALFKAAANWARSRGAVALRIETQTINVAACRFYAAQGCTLAVVDLHAYPELPHETQLIWHLKL
ncbi:MAG TPA: GNAT family N-acetyltransferase [Pyrinomonadaceae bacterium]